MNFVACHQYFQSVEDNKIKKENVWGAQHHFVENKFLIYVAMCICVHQPRCWIIFLSIGYDPNVGNHCPRCGLTNLPALSCLLFHNCRPLHTQSVSPSVTGQH